MQQEIILECVLSVFSHLLGDLDLLIINYHREVSEVDSLTWKEVLRRTSYSVMCSLPCAGQTPHFGLGLSLPLG